MNFLMTCFFLRQSCAIRMPPAGASRSRRHNRRSLHVSAETAPVRGQPAAHYNKKTQKRRKLPLTTSIFLNKLCKYNSSRRVQRTMAGSAATSSNLSKPSVSPPNAAFEGVWPCLEGSPTMQNRSALQPVRSSQNMMSMRLDVERDSAVPQLPVPSTHQPRSKRFALTAKWTGKMA